MIVPRHCYITEAYDRNNIFYFNNNEFQSNNEESYNISLAFQMVSGRTFAALQDGAMAGT